MKKLRLIDKYNYIDRFNTTIHCRVYSHDKLPDSRVLIEVTKSYDKGETYRTWYCPPISQYKGQKTIGKRRKLTMHEDDLGGCAGLGYWFTKYHLK